ncbi:DUF4972 domain-containing protein [Dysgonomonas sp. Marseille-P4677]|uniref:DUF4972 domain-containing protein n=1 Tax=Dysgonomonas sp. Marseille-P4677 TaxID=2364790 RepID=UPI001913C92A|nr:DUF4972 domain-containing protein [Dysgonomonas sp. Marseille-P4677]MBK5722058.1 DUF4972 domain-containing protein [Dysgonomonas sp. Marseille-P4677]
MKSTANVHFITRILIACVFLLSMSFSSCTEEKNDTIRDRNPQIETLGASLTELKTLREESKYGTIKGQYPEESKVILNDAMAVLGRLILDIDEGKSTSQSEIDQAITNAQKAIDNFKASVRTETVLFPAELYVNGDDGGYIDFGTSDDYIKFGEPRNRAYTVELWLKFRTMPGGIGAVVSTFLEDNGVRCGWMVNVINGDYLRMTFAQKEQHKLWEPGDGFGEANKWIHVAVVYNDKGVDGEMEDGKPVVAKYYANGVLKNRVVNGESYTGNYYGANDNNLPNLPMIAFAQYETNGNKTRKSQGYIKHFHIWKTSKSEADIKALMNGTTKVTGKEADLACGWAFDETVEDDQNIKDLTGKHTAAVKGKYQWQILE